MSRVMDRRGFLKLLFITELVLVLLAMLTLWVRSGDAWGFPFRLDAIALVYGALAALPPLLVVTVIYLPWTAWVPALHRAAQAILARLAQVLREPLLALSAVDIVLLSVAAGIGEELFFRGALQPWLGLWAASIIFGALHALTLLYFVLATAIGFYFGWLFELTGNLLVPIVAHAAYDIAALLLLQRLLRRMEPNISKS